MKRIINLVLAGLLATSAKGQVIEQVKYKSEAQVIVRFVYNKYQADAIVCKGYKYEAKQKAGIWHYSSNDPYRVRIYVTEYAHEADINIFVALNKWEIKTSDDYNGLFYEERD